MLPNSISRADALQGYDPNEYIALMVGLGTSRSIRAELKRRRGVQVTDEQLSAICRGMSWPLHKVNRWGIHFLADFNKAVDAVLN